MTVIIYDDSGLPATIYSYLLFDFSYQLSTMRQNFTHDHLSITK